MRRLALRSRSWGVGFFAGQLHEAIGIKLDKENRHIYVTGLGGAVYVWLGGMIGARCMFEGEKRRRRRGTDSKVGIEGQRKRHGDEPQGIIYTDTMLGNEVAVHLHHLNEGSD